MAVIYTRYYTDPACPWSWALEPAFRRLRRELGEEIELSYVMCGMARQFGRAEELVAESLEAGALSGMPVDARVWLKDPPRSSHPACIAVKAAAEQGDPGRYLRRLREGFLCRRRRLDGTEALVEEARATAGLDLERFRIDLASHGTLESLAADLELASEVAPEHRSPGGERVKLPSVEFRSQDGGVHGVYGFTAYEELRAAALAAGAQPAATPAPGVLEALRSFASMATAEVAAVCELPGPRAPAELWRLASEWLVEAERVGGGELWTLA